MTSDLTGELVAYLADARAMELRALELLGECIDRAGDETIAAIYRSHRVQTEEHVRGVTERLAVYSEGRDPDALASVGPRNIELLATSALDSPATLARTAYAFENLEIAAYHLLGWLAERVGDTDTLAVVQRILEQEEAAAELLASQFDRMLEIAFG
jgi:ferritin-like metal-binding protein YciE